MRNPSHLQCMNLKPPTTARLAPTSPAYAFTAASLRSGRSWPAVARWPHPSARRAPQRVSHLPLPVARPDDPIASGRSVYFLIVHTAAASHYADLHSRPPPVVQIYDF
ncbi:hypothetical protein GUJ93_ZPchr0013g37117 [Zizania palustris]|uniref:Uncharacterized protein n=1 Tax=Zizania palustris TaxID=103762 RepID=A0A8J5WW37_ZIZPA|nr:hypothetical protein GUJ93_ZPchr0013g37117 [Zizania palustris]